MPKIAYFVVAGQSLADAWFTQPGVLAAFKHEFIAKNPQYDDVQYYDAAVGGSAMLKGSADLNYTDSKDPATLSNYWYNETTKTNGPKLDQFESKLHAWATGKSVLGIIWDQGQADTRYVIDATKAAAYTEGLDYVFKKLLTASGAAKVYIEAFGDRAVYSARLHAGQDLMHQIQQEFAARHDYARLVTATYDLPLTNTVHLTNPSAITAAKRMADAISTGIVSPILDHATMAKDGKVYAAFALHVGQELDVPAMLAGFHLNGAAGAIASITVDYAADLIIITPTAATPHAKLQYASSTYSFKMSGNDMFTANGPTGHLPVQPFTVELDNSGVAINARGKEVGGFTFTGDSKSNSIHGFASGDALRGYGGNDRLDGGAGNDALYGGTGQDTFVMSTGMGRDRVYDFNAAEDHIELAEINFADLQIRRLGADATDICGPHGEHLILNGILPDKLSLDRFIHTDGDYIIT